MESIVVSEPNTSAVIPTAEVLSHLRLNDDAESGMVAAWVAAAASLFEAFTGYVLLDSEHRLSLDGWPGPVVYIARRPVTQIDTVEYLDPEGEWQELAGCTADLDAAPARVVLPTDLPSLAERSGPRVRVTFRAGNEVPAYIPPLILAAVKLMAAHFWSAREAYSETELKAVPAGWKAVCDLHRVSVLGGDNDASR